MRSEREDNLLSARVSDGAVNFDDDTLVLNV